MTKYMLLQLNQHHFLIQMLCRYHLHLPILLQMLLYSNLLLHFLPRKILFQHALISTAYLILLRQNIRIPRLRQDSQILPCHFFHRYRQHLHYHRMDYYSPHKVLEHRMAPLFIITVMIICDYFDRSSKTLNGIIVITPSLLTGHD